jgi:hypothetical protein
MVLVGLESTLCQTTTNSPLVRVAIMGTLWVLGVVELTVNSGVM